MSEHTHELLGEIAENLRRNTDALVIANKLKYHEILLANADGGRPRLDAMEAFEKLGETINGPRPADEPGN